MLGCTTLFFFAFTCTLTHLFMQESKKMQSPHPEIIGRKELMARLGISEATSVKLDKAGKIKSFKVGNSVRYNWDEVFANLQANGLNGK